MFTGVPVYYSTGVSVYYSTGVPEYYSTGVSVYYSTGVPVYYSTGVPVYYEYPYVSLVLKIDYPPAISICCLRDLHSNNVIEISLLTGLFQTF